MNGALKLVGPLIVVLAVSACNSSGGSSNLPGSPGLANAAMQPMQPETASELKLWGPNVHRVCPAARPGEMQCDAMIYTGGPRPDVGTGPGGGYTPAELDAAYNLPTTKGAGTLVAVVDAYDNPNAASDLAFYRSYFGLPVATFNKYNQTGQQSNYPAGNHNWGLEEDLDLQMVSASCPLCKIDLIEANSNQDTDLSAAEVEAVKLGATIVSNSYGGLCRHACWKRFAKVLSKDYATPGITYLASAGDFGYGSNFPAQLSTVVAVGGTRLVQVGGKRGYTETAWSGTGGGCSDDIKKPAWQHDPGCKHRMQNDVAAVADPGTGVSEYDTYGYAGWFPIGGTSVSSPLLAGVFALAGNSTKQNGGETFWELNHQGTRDLYHVNAGVDGMCSSPWLYFCEDGTHEYRDYGGPTGWGTPHGIGAF